MELPARPRRPGALSGLILFLATTSADAGIGRTPGFASVSADGEAEYAIPLSLPAGTNGMTPVLSLEYRHRTRNGLLGVGWSIGGLSQIGRCQRTIAQDGIAIWPNHNSNDRFCLDGQRMVAMDVLAYGAPSGEYRTEIESYARIRAHAGAGTGPGHFTVEAADGRTYEYGATADSRIDRSASTTTALATFWALNRIRDRSGNVIDYSYFEDTSNGSFRLTGIRYNSNPAAGVAASHQVSFAYENRPVNEVDTGYVAGAPVRQVVRLERVDIRYNAALLRRYELDYEPALSAGGRSRLATLRECGAGGGDCLAPTTFTWQETAPGFAAATVVTAALPGTADAQSLSKSIDINGDGRLDYVWAGGSTPATATIRFRLGTATGFGPEVNSGIPCPQGLGRSFDSNGDGRADLLLIGPSGRFSIVAGRDGGLAAPVATDVVVPARLRDYRGLDFNGDGLGDIAWSEEIGPTSATSLVVRARNRLRTGGYAAISTLFTQQDASVAGVVGGSFLGREGRVDLNGDGAEDLLMNEEFSIARISAVSNGSDRFDGGVFHGGVVLDFNDDGCSDFAYKHPTGRLRVRVNFCGTGGTTGELLGPAWTGAAVLRAHDWNGDGRDDVLLQGPANWLVAISNGDSLGPIVDTGVLHEGAQTTTGIDVDGDGLHDLVTRSANQVRVRLKNGAPPDLLLSAEDGFGVSAAFRYGPLTDAAVHTRGTGAAYPDQDVQTPVQVVTRLTTTDASGRDRMSATGYRYEGWRRNLHGRGSLGFRKQALTDLTSGRMLGTEVMRRQDFPFTGLPESIAVRQSSGKPVSHSSYQWSKLDLGSRRFPYPVAATLRRYEAGGAYDGVEITRIVRGVSAIDAASGIVTDETTTITEMGGGAHAGSAASFRIQHADVLNDVANWCLGKAQSIQLTAGHTVTGGAPLVREASQAWNTAKCRPTQLRMQPGDAQSNVAYALAYDAFGNLSSEKVTGAGMTARSMTIDWGARGQLPATIGNPLAQLTRLSWDAASGLPLSQTDPNGLKTSWSYDPFGRLMREVQPDGTSTTWMRDGCKGTCDERSIYRLVQEDRDTGGAARVTTSLEVDQHERGVRLKTPQPGGGWSVTRVDRDDRGLVLRHYLPQWDGDFASAHWSFTYDALGRRTGAQLRGPNGTTERSIAIQYDGLETTQADALGRTTTGIRTAWGRLSEVVDAAGGRSRYEYDAFGNLLRVRDALGNIVATIGYNARGMKLTQADMDAGTWTWTRNALGETTALRDANGQTIRFEYDLLGRVTKRTAPDGTATWTWGKTASKKDIGRLATLAGPGYAESFAYDAVGRPASQTIATDASYRFDYAYNPLGLLDSITYPAAGPGNAFRVGHVYEAGRLAGIRNASAPGESYWKLNAVDASGNHLDETLGAAIRVVSGFDPVTGMLEYRQSGAGGGAAVQNLTYAWDANGNLTSRADLNRSVSEDFRYDLLDRLDESRRNGAINLELDYDAIGNIRRKSDVCSGTTACYAYHAQRKHAVTSAGGVSYTYDANGNMKSHGGAAIAWTSANLPSSIAAANGNSSQFSYGPDGNRWKQVAKHGAVTETTHYAGGLVEKVTRSGKTTWRHYVLAPTGTAAVHLRHADGSAPAMRYLTRDHLGSTDRILDAAGNVVVAESFAPFGSRRGTSWQGVPAAADMTKIAGVTRDGFTGHEHLDNLGLIHMNGRVYDPRLGRFISADPYVALPFDGQGLNRYSYVLNNPLTFSDPSGFDAIPCMESSPGTCAQVTVVGVEWADWIRYFGAASAQAASARERDPCGQESDAFACAMQGRQFVSPASIVLTVGSRPDPSLSRGRLDVFQGAVARVANLAISSSPVALLFGADPDFEWFDVPDSDPGRQGAALGNVGYLVGGFAGIVRKGGSEIIGSPSQFARSLQGTDSYPGIDRFKDIVLKKGTIVYAGFPGQGHFYTSRSALRRVEDSASALSRGLQIAPHRRKPLRTRYAAYEVVEDTNAAFGLAIANQVHGTGRLPQIVVPSFETRLRFLDDFPLGP